MAGPKKAGGLLVALGLGKPKKGAPDLGSEPDMDEDQDQDHDADGDFDAAASAVFDAVVENDIEGFKSALKTAIAACNETEY